MSTVDTLEISIETNAKNAVESINEMTKSLERFRKNIETAQQSMKSCAQSLDEQTRKVSENFDKLVNEKSKKLGTLGKSEKTIVEFNSKVKNSLKGMTNYFSLATRKILKISAMIYSLKHILSNVLGGIKGAMNYIETLNYFEAGFGQISKTAKGKWRQLGYESAESYANSFEERAKKVTEKMSGFKIDTTGQLVPGDKKSLGMSPTELMNYQAVFAQMSNSMGVTAETSLKLSNALTKIGGDLASVKNMDFNQVWTDMQSGLVGMSRTLDKYGVNIRNVNMQQKLTELGINANIQALNQNDKALLRTIILLDSSRYAWGDLAKTINQPANQLRLVKASFTNLARTLGELFIPIIAKVLPIINALLVALQRLAYFIGKLFGVKFKGSSGGKGGGGVFDFGADADALDDAAAGAGNLGSGLGHAADNAKKLRDHLLSIDELNVYNEEEPSTGGGGGGGGGAGGGIDTGLLESALDKILDEYERAWDESFNRMEERANRFADNVAKAFKEGGLEGVGEYLSKSLEEQLRKINWEKIYQGARTFGTGLANFLNGLIRPETFGAVGMTVANSLNTAIQFAFSFGTTFDFKNLGDSIAQGINNFFANFDFVKFANTIDEFVQGLFTAISTALTNIKWTDVLNGITDFFENLDVGTISIVISAISIKKILGLKIGSNVLKHIQEKLGEKIALFLASNGVNLSTIGLTFKAGVGALFGGEASKSALAFISTFAKAITGIGAIVAGLMGGFTSFFAMIEHGFSWMKEIIMVISTGLVAVGAVILGAPALVTGVIAAIVASVATATIVIKDNWEKIKNFFIKAWGKIEEVWTEAAEWFKGNVAEPVSDLFSKCTESIEEFFSNRWGKIKSIWGKASEWFNNYVIEPVVTFFKGCVERISKFFEGCWIIIQAIWKIVSGWFNSYVITPLINFFSPIVDKISGFFSSAWSLVKNVWNSVSGWFDKNVITPVSNAFNTMKDTIKAAFDKVWSGIKNGVASAMNFVISKIEGGINGIVGGLNTVIDKFNTIVTKAGDVIGANWSGIKKIPKASLPRISAYATGGFPTMGDFFFANENGVPELVGTMNGRTAVASGMEITGIKEAVYESGNAQARLLSTAIKLLQIISEKDPRFEIDGREIVNVYDERKRRNGYSFT